jgi:hypothetical protein
MRRKGEFRLNLFARTMQTTQRRRRTRIRALACGVTAWP